MFIIKTKNKIMDFCISLSIKLLVFILLFFNLNLSIFSVEMNNQDQELLALLSEQKFINTPGQIESRRILIQNEINILIKKIIHIHFQNRTKDKILSLIKENLSITSVSDTEDKEAYAIYIERILSLLNIESSDGILNRWMYGIDIN